MIIQNKTCYNVQFAVKVCSKTLGILLKTFEITKTNCKYLGLKKQSVIGSFSTIFGFINARKMWRTYLPGVLEISSKSPKLPMAIGYLAKCPRSYKSHNSSCCSRATSNASNVAFKDGFIADTSATTSIALVHRTGLLLTYSHDRAATPFPISWPLLSSLPFPCQVTYNS